MAHRAGAKGMQPNPVNTPDKNIESARSFAVDLAKAASETIRRDFAWRTETEKKVDGTDVTSTDKVVNAMIINAVNKEFPNHDIFGEEKSDMTRKSSYVWVCDPLDGTTVFSKGIPTFSFALSLVINGTPNIGVIADSSGRMYVGMLGKGSFLDGERLHVSKHDRLEKALIGISSWKGEQISLIKMPEKLRSEGAGFLDLGSIASMGALVSCGNMTASVHPADKPWESAALKVIVTEAGGRVTDLYGNEQRYDREIRGGIISNGLIHDELLRLVRSCGNSQ